MTAAAYWPPRDKFQIPEPPPEHNPSDWWDKFQLNNDIYQPPQQRDWTCSACSLNWFERISEINPNITREQTVYEIGYPEQINEHYGLTNINGPGQALINVLATYDIEARQDWMDFDTVYMKAQETALLMSGANWYHWVAVRGIIDWDLWIANSAPGYKGVDERLSRADFNRLGSFSVVELVR